MKPENQIAASVRVLRRRVRHAAALYWSSLAVDSRGLQHDNPCYSRVMKKTQRRRLGRAKLIPVSRRIDVTRAEFNRVIAILNERGAIINGLRDNQEMQFKRIAQLQAELDLLRRAWERTRFVG